MILVLGHFVFISYNKTNGASVSVSQTAKENGALKLAKTKLIRTHGKANIGNN